MRVRRVNEKENVPDLGTKTLSKAVIAKHSVTEGDVNMTEKKGGRCAAERGDALGLRFKATGRNPRNQVQVFETGDRTVSLQTSVGDHAKHQ